jgi:hypothetical protein
MPLIVALACRARRLDCDTFVSVTTFPIAPLLAMIRASYSRKSELRPICRPLMSEEEEREFLQPWAEQALAGGVLVLSPIRAALAQRLGRKVATSVVYRFLARHGWRKVAPGTRHPKNDPQIQETWKKNFPKTWRPC